MDRNRAATRDCSSEYFTSPALPVSYALQERYGHRGTSSLSFESAFVNDSSSPEAAALAPPAVPASPPQTSKRRYDRSIVEGPLRAAVWKIAWPTVLTNVLGGLQGIVDHVL